MDPTKCENNGGEKREKGDDEESILSDRCWEEMYRGDSRKWLIRDGSRKQDDPPLCSTMKETYPYPVNDLEIKIKGKRRLLMEAKLLQDVEKEIEEKKTVTVQATEYLTTYDDLHRTPGFRPEKKNYDKNRELYEKYPLYTSAPMSFWQFQYDGYNGGGIGAGGTASRTMLPGLTSTLDLKHPFKRHAGFTTPVAEALDADEH